MYIARLYQKAKRYQDALDFLKNSEDLIVDKHGMKIMRAEIYMNSGDTETAKTLYRELIKTNPENYNFHLALIEAYKIGTSFDDLSDTQIEDLRKLYSELRTDFPRCAALQTIPLRFHKAGDSFTTELENYVRPALRKGVPSLFATLNYFYDNSPDKAKIIGDLVHKYYDSLKKTDRFPGCENEGV